MLLSNLPYLVVALVAPAALAAPANSLQKRAPTIYIAGDSTTAESGGGSGTQGWGHYLAYSIQGATVVNKAVAGRSARSYTREGRFQAIADVLQSGDYVVVEFGHNDGGSLSTDNGRTDCPGAGSETCQTTYDGVAETVLTYPAYLINAGNLFIAKGAKVIFSSPTPNNVWETGTWTYSASRFTTYCQSAASTVGSSAAFVDHGQYTANIYKTLGATAVDAFYPNDHTHTSPEGAATVAQAFVKGLACGGSALASYVKNSTSSIPGSCI